MPTRRQLDRFALGSEPRNPGPPLRQGGRLLDLMMYQGQQQADAARAQGDIWGNAVQQIGTGLATGIQQHQEQQKLKKRDAAFIAALNDPALAANPRLAYSRFLEIGGPELGQEMFKGYVGAMQLTQEKRNPEMDQKGAAAMLGAYMRMPPEGRAQMYPSLRATVGKGYPDYAAKMPEAHDVAFDDNVIGPMASQLAPPPEKKTRAVKTRRADGSEVEQIVEDVPGQTFESTPEPKVPKLYSQTVKGPGGGPVAKLFTEEQMAAGVPTYREPRAPREPNLQLIERVGPDGKTIKEFVQPKLGMSFETPAKAPPQQRLTKDERQDFAAWNYALPKLEGFTKYVQTNPGKFGSLDALVQGAKQKIPGFAESDYASNRAFIARVNSEIRHALYGASLTGGEQQSAEGFIVSEEDQPEVIVAKVTEAMNRANSYREYYTGLGFSLPRPGNKGPAAPGGKRTDDDPLGLR